MNPITYFFWLIEQASGGLFYIWPVTLGILIFAIVAFIFVLKTQKEAFQKNYKFLPVPLIGTVIILLVGVLFEKKENFIFTTYFAIGFTVLLAGISIYKSKNIWPIAVTSSLLILWFSFWCWFVSGMSITGDWL